MQDSNVWVEWKQRCFEGTKSQKPRAALIPCAWDTPWNPSTALNTSWKTRLLKCPEYSLKAGGNGSWSPGPSWLKRELSSWPCQVLLVFRASRRRVRDTVQSKEPACRRIGLAVSRKEPRSSLYGGKTKNVLRVTYRPGAPFSYKLYRRSTRVSEIHWLWLHCNAWVYSYHLRVCYITVTLSVTGS